VSDWRPNASIEVLQRRAALFADIRDFFRSRGVLEVDTPLLGAFGVTDPALEPLIVAHCRAASVPRFLQTSPEYAMKRLLAAGSGPIYQIAHAFRDDEYGRRHNPEFTLLEWYRPGYDLPALMDEVADLVLGLLGRETRELVTYRQLFLDTLDLDPFMAPLEELVAAARGCIEAPDLGTDRDAWLDLLMSHVVEPALAHRGVVFVHGYPPSQAALARGADVDGVEVAQRFELYVDGLELANGFHELADATEQARRFEADNALRRARAQPERAADTRLLAALAAGLPDCSGVALGLDRLLMLRCSAAGLAEVLPFDWQRS
jgi:lysyl-tRNA synthetase class 2